MAKKQMTAFPTDWTRQRIVESLKNRLRDRYAEERLQTWWDIEYRLGWQEIDLIFYGLVNYQTYDRSSKVSKKKDEVFNKFKSLDNGKRLELMVENYIKDTIGGKDSYSFSNLIRRINNSSEQQDPYFISYKTKIQDYILGYIQTAYVKKNYDGVMNILRELRNNGSVLSKDKIIEIINDMYKKAPKQSQLFGECETFIAENRIKKELAVTVHDIFGEKVINKIDNEITDKADKSELFFLG